MSPCIPGLGETPRVEPQFALGDLRTCCRDCSEGNCSPQPVRANWAVFAHHQSGDYHAPSNASAVDLTRAVAECYGHRSFGRGPTL